MAKTRKKTEPPSQTLLVALDPGTATTYVCLKFPDGRLEVVSDPDGNCPTLTATALENGDPDHPFFGRTAINYRAAHPEWTSVLNKLARGQGVPMLVDKNGRPWLAEELEALFVKWLLSGIEERTGMKVGGVLVTVPSSFDDTTRRASMDVAENAGFKCLGVINEPSAAVVGFVLKHPDEHRTLMVVDVGCGTTDVTILATEPGNKFTVLATAGRNDNAGREFTLQLMAMCQETMAAQGIHLTPEEHLRDFIMMESACEEGKIALTTQSSAYITWHAIQRLFERNVSRTEFDQGCAPLLDKMRDLVTEALHMAKKAPGQIDGVILVGGGSRVPSIRQMVESVFGPDAILKDVEDPGKSIVLGAGMCLDLKIHEAYASGQTDLAELASYNLPTMELREIIGLAVGVSAIQRGTNQIVFAPILEANTPVPATASRTFGILVPSVGNATDAKIVVLEAEVE